MKQRNAQYEFIRTVAMIQVVLLHTLNNLPQNNEAETFCFQFLTTGLLVCNGLFFMLSGKFALETRCDSWDDCRRYYLKKLVNLGLPVLLYMLLRTMYDMQWSFTAKALVKQYIINVSDQYMYGEYWFLYFLAGMLLMAPVMGRFFREADEKTLLLVLLLGYGFNILKTYAPVKELSWNWQYPLSGWPLFFPLGLCLERLVTTRKRERIVYILSAASFVTTLVQRRLDWAPSYMDLAPTYACIVCGAFLGLKKIYRSGKWMDKVIIWMGKYSMPVYMLHYVLLHTLLKYISIPNYLAQAAVVGTLTVALSLVLGFAINSILVFPIQKFLLKRLGLAKVTT